MPTFDGDNLVITLDTGVTVLDAEVDLYSAWKNWQLAGNMRFPQAFRTIGGDSLTPGVDAGAYFFIQNDLGWRIKPPEEDTTILLTGNLSPEDSSLPILIPTTGAYTVLVQGIQPITQNIDTIKTSLEFSTFNGGVYWNALTGKTSITNADTDGNEKNALKNLADVQTQAEALGFTKIYVVENATVGATDVLTDYSLVGINSSQTKLTFVAGSTTGNTQFEDLELTGTLSGALYIDDCHLSALSGIGCTTAESIIKNTILDSNTIALRGDNSRLVHLLNCSSAGAGTTLDMNGSTGSIHIHHYQGLMTLTGMTSASTLSFDSPGGELTVDSGCTAGTVNSSGARPPVDNSGAGCTVKDYSTPSEVWTVTNGAFVRKILMNKRETDPVTGITTVYDDDNTTIIYQGNIWENVGGTTPYTGGVINRQDRLVAP